MAVVTEESKTGAYLERQRNRESVPCISGYQRSTSGDYGSSRYSEYVQIRILTDEVEVDRCKGEMAGDIKRPERMLTEGTW